ncbi:MAG: porin family protein [Gammaproteobacteria bacterium]|nr:porin family protein [Gammaproteobacteria bacterium]
MLTLCCTAPVYAAHSVDSLATPVPADIPDETRAAIEAALAQSEHLLAVGQPVAAFAVLMQTMESLPEGADDSTLRFGIAQALLEGGRFSQAEQVLSRLAEEHPDNLRVRLDWALALFALGRDDEAKALFRDARRQANLPPDARRKVEGILGDMLERKRLRIDLDLGLWYDDNVNNASEVDTVQIPAFGGLPFQIDQRPVSAWVARTGASVRWRKAPTGDGRVLIEARGGAVRNTAISETEHNRTWLNLSAGPRFGYVVTVAGRPRPGRISADIGAERRMRGGHGEATSFWGGVHLDQVLNADWRVGISPRLWSTRLDDQPDEADPTGASLDLSVLRRAGPGWLSVRGTLSRENADRRSLDWSSRGLDLGYAAEVGDAWSGSVRLGLNRLRFDEADALFLRRREDRTRSASLTLSHREISWEGYQPVLMLDWSKTDSSVPFYDRKLLSLRVGLRRLF